MIIMMKKKNKLKLNYFKKVINIKLEVLLYKIEIDYYEKNAFFSILFLN